jgi:chorismate lyase
LQVLLKCGQVPLVYASSWWNSTAIDEFLKDKSQPIWVSLSQGHTEIYRDIKTVYKGHNKELEGLLGCKGPFWGREYYFWHKGKPLCMIFEAFSPKLSQYLGPESTIYDKHCL